MIKLKNGNVITPYRQIPGMDILCSDEKILYVGKTKEDLEVDLEIDLSGLNVAPGFVDIHVHGGGDCEFWSANSEEIVQAARFHAEYGTTSVVPTIDHAAQIQLTDQVKARLDAFAEAKKSEEPKAELLGLHIEGPNTSPKQPMGANQGVIEAEAQRYRAYMDYADGNILRWTVAPEIPGVPEMISDLVREGVRMSIGHSEPDTDAVYQAVELGATHVTHLYSGMNMVHRENGKRYAGLLEAAYLIDDLYVEMVGNGSHLSKELLRMIYEIKGANRVCVVSDAASVSGRPEGPVEYNGEKGYIKDGAILREDCSGFLGSAITYDRILYNLVHLAGIPLIDAVRMCSLTPAKSVGVGNRKGVLASGYDADIIAFDDRMNIKFVMARGKTVRY